MKKLFFLLLFVSPIFAGSFREYRITSSPSNQYSLRIDSNLVIWKDAGGSPILGADINDINNIMYLELPGSDDIGGNIVVYSVSGNIWGYNLDTKQSFLIKDSSTPYYYPRTNGNIVTYKADGLVPVVFYDLQWKSETVIPNTQNSGIAKVDGDLIVWSDSNLMGFKISTFEKFQIVTGGGQFDISGNLVALQRSDGLNSNIYAIDISDPFNPIEFPVCTDANEQRAPAVSGNIVVWQDTRNGNWDIYGYDISTQTEFQITDNAADQEYPDISGYTVVWEDNRNGQTDVYATILYGAQVPKCLSPLQGDLNNDCKIDFTDFALLTANWLECNLDPPSACWE
jgi:beta propeller repeat protein